MLRSYKKSDCPAGWSESLAGWNGWIAFDYRIRCNLLVCFSEDKLFARNSSRLPVSSLRSLLKVSSNLFTMRICRRARRHRGPNAQRFEASSFWPSEARLSINALKLNSHYDIINVISVPDHLAGHSTHLLETNLFVDVDRSWIAREYLQFNKCKTRFARFIQKGFHHFTAYSDVSEFPGN